MNDTTHMQTALDAAAQAEASGEVPVGAVLVIGGAVLATGFNQSIQSKDPTAHAEIVALREAARQLANYRLAGATLYTTLEPCAMCAGAIAHARVATVVIAADDPKAGACGSVLDVFATSHHKPVVRRGVLAEAAQAQLKNFFKMRRMTETKPVIAVRAAEWAGQDRALLSRIRFTVFVEEQKVPAEIEIDALDPDCEHALAFDPGGQAIGCGRLLPDGHIGRMAVLAAWRGRGVGARVLLHLIERATARGFSEVVLSAQTHAIGFYERMGFTAYGDIYLDAGIPHRDMALSIKKL
jgi:tRNA(adenine34) deaminase